MATRKKNFLKGIMGSLVFRELNGKQSVSTRVAKGTLKQTKGMILAGSTFGLASILGSNIRKLLQPLTGGLVDAGMVNRMNGKLIEALNEALDPETKQYVFEVYSFDHLEGFDLNLHSPLSKSLTDPPLITLDSGTLKVSVATKGVPLKLKFPVGSSSCDIILSMATLRLKDGLRIYAPSNQVKTIKKDEALVDGLDFKFEIPDGCLSVFSIFLKYYTKNFSRDVITNTRKFSPGKICVALISPGTYEEKDRAHWIRMGKLKFES